MSLSEKASTRTPKKLPAQGIQPARCYAIIDLGTQTGTFKGKPTTPAPKVMLLWELTKFMTVPEDTTKRPYPATVRQEYSFSTGSKAKLPDVLKAWGGLKKRPEKIGPDLLKKYVGAPCMITIEHSEDGQWANVGSGGRAVSPFMKEAFAKPEPHHKDLFFNLDEFTWEKFYAVPEFVQKIIRKSLEWPNIIAKNPEPVSQATPGAPQGLEETEGIHTEVDEDAPAF